MSATGDLEIQRLSMEYPAMINAFANHAAEISTRLGDAKEILGFTLRLYEPEHCVVGRQHLSREFMDAEILQLLAGEFDEGLLRKAVPRAADLISVATSYGPRVREQMPHAIEELRETNTRRAVVYIGRPGDLAAVRDDDPAVKGEMPCTMIWQFQLRDNQLWMLVAMRSWDIVWGLCYDVPSFVAVQMAVARDLGAELGPYVHFAGNAHIYKKHYDIEVWDNPDGELEVPYIDDEWELTAKNARDLLSLERATL